MSFYVYLNLISKTGNPAKSFRITLGALLIKEMKDLTDEELVEDIRENPYYQYFLGLESFQDEAPFETSTLVHFLKRISKEILCEINEMITKRTKEVEAKESPDDSCDDGSPSADAGGDDGDAKEPVTEETHKGKLLVDATCIPADIRYPTDLGLLNEAREKLEDILDVLHGPLEGIKKKPNPHRRCIRGCKMQIHP